MPSFLNDVQQYSRQNCADHRALIAQLFDDTADLGHLLGIGVGEFATADEQAALQADAGIAAHHRGLRRKRHLVPAPSTDQRYWLPNSLSAVRFVNSFLAAAVMLCVADGCPYLLAGRADGKSTFNPGVSRTFEACLPASGSASGACRHTRAKMLRFGEIQVSLDKDKIGLVTYSRCRHLAIERAKPVLINAQLAAGICSPRSKIFCALRRSLKSR